MEKKVKSGPAPGGKLTTRELTPARWPDLERLFGQNGACGGCWCQWWRLERGERWAEVKGACARARLREQVRSGRAHGVLAYLGGEPVGWCSFDRRVDYPRLDRAPSLRCEDAERVWSIPCFFVKPGLRGRGVATALLERALRALERRRARLVEAYPVRPTRAGSAIPAAFAWTGTESLFLKAGFHPVGPRKAGKQRLRKAL
ncbi:MAG TPA: GNAT family N-acetyltransferase [Myxococcota bacterium]|nr:GNAT family N-acetyltransferase [Myxococcota bacterium]HRY97022.1 GNAT family N-acetyltransferase [Myxococcota bacterium]HSA23140.1 GNAT family N-acetyltransferase [Myxococcota bacterium]